MVGEGGGPRLGAQRAIARLAEVVADLGAAFERAIRLGVPEADLIVDPGIGFGKTADHNVDVLAGLGALCLRFQRGCGVRGWGRDGLGTGARGRGARARRALMSTTRRRDGRFE